MKRIAALFITFVLLSAFASADALDPIIGVWYANIETRDLPQIDGYEDLIRSVMIMTFEENGNITYKSIDFKATTINEEPAAIAGKWENKLLYYNVSIIGGGEYRSYLRNDILSISFDGQTYYMFRKMVPFDIYNDLKAY